MGGRSPGHLLVLGTDTGVGKTWLSAALVGLLQRRGRPAGWLKPLGTEAMDTPEGRAQPDAVFVRERTGLSTPYHQMVPVLADLPAAPAEALKAEGRELDYPGLVATCRRRLAGPETMVIEGVGGPLVPIGAGRLFIELARDLAAENNLALVLVARPGLGTINHTLLALRELDRAGLDCRGFFFSGPGDDITSATNAGWISSFHPAPFRGRLPDGQNLAWPDFLDRAEAALDLSGLPGFDG